MDDEKPGTGRKDASKGFKDGYEAGADKLENDEARSGLEIVVGPSEEALPDQHKMYTNKRRHAQKSLHGDVDGNGSTSESNDRLNLFHRCQENLIAQQGTSAITNRQARYTFRRVRRRRVFIEKLRCRRGSKNLIYNSLQNEADEFPRSTSPSSWGNGFTGESGIRQQAERRKSRNVANDSSMDREPARKLFRCGTSQSIYEQRSGITRSKSARCRSSTSRILQSSINGSEAPSDFAEEMNRLNLAFQNLGYDPTHPLSFANPFTEGNGQANADILLGQLKALSLSSFDTGKGNRVIGSVSGQVMPGASVLSSLDSGDQESSKLFVNLPNTFSTFPIVNPNSDPNKFMISKDKQNITKVTDICEVFTNLQVIPAFLNPSNIEVPALTETRGNIPIVSSDIVLPACDTSEVPNLQHVHHDEFLPNTDVYDQVLKPKEHQ